MKLDLDRPDCKWVRALKTGMALLLVISPLFCSTQKTRAETAVPGIDEIMHLRFAASDFNGAVLVARDGQIIYEHAFGLANREWDIPNDVQTKFEIGSMTKQFTALLILQLVNEGRISLDGHVLDYLPYYRKDTGNRITV